MIERRNVINLEFTSQTQRVGFKIQRQCVVNCLLCFLMLHNLVVSIYGLIKEVVSVECSVQVNV
jgi:hypothetical protein